MRSRLAVLLVIPLVLAGVLGGLRIAASVGDVRDLAAVQRQVALSERVATVTDALQTERHLAAAAAATGAAGQRTLVDEQTQQVDADVTAMRALEANPDALEATPAAAYQDVLTRLDTLPDVRERVFAPGTTVDLAIGRYSEVITSLLRFNRVALAGTAADSAALAAGIGYLAEAKEQLSVQHALLLAASLGNLITSVEESQLRGTDAAFDSAIRNFAESVPSAQRQIYFTTVRGNATTDRQRLLLIGLGEWPTFVALDSIATEWDETTTAIGGMLFAVEASLSDDLLTATAAASDTAVTDVIRDASVVALLLVLAVILLVLVARSVLRPLHALRTSALDVAQRRLPATVEQLSRPGGWTDDVRPERVPVHTREDIGQVARAFDEVHSEAVRLATEQAMMRSTVNDTFVNLSRRSQSLVERQLRIIDSLESGERDPEALGELFRLDHLATRMRRNNENLLVLAGSVPRQRAGQSRLVLDVLRGAISEIEEYPRITIDSVPDAAVNGIAVNDLVHLTAELLDNAATSSPKQAQVVLTSSLQPDGRLLVEIRDTGVGMSATQRDAINDRLADPPVVDVSVSRHMGLFVVGHLAARHGITVRVQETGDDGGLTAAVSVPSELISSDARRPSLAPQAADPVETRTVVEPGATPSTAPVGTGSIFDSIAASTLSMPGTDLGLAHGEPAVNLFAATLNAAPPGRDEPSNLFAAIPHADSSSQEPETSTGTPIFHEMRSAWFRQLRTIPVDGERDGDRDHRVTSGDSVAASTMLAGPLQALPSESLPTSDFGSSADEGWLLAEQLRTPVNAGTTQAGLPRRRPRAHLVPGTTSRPAAESGTSPAGRTDNVSRLRDAERVRGNLNSYQRGTRRGRHSSPVEEAKDSIEDPTDAGVGSHRAAPSSQERQ